MAAREFYVACEWKDGRQEVKVAGSVHEVAAMAFALAIQDGEAVGFPTEQQAQTWLDER